MAASDRRAQKEDGITRFDPRILDLSVIATPLLEEINKDDNEVHAVMWRPVVDSVSLKVLDDEGNGEVSNLIAAIAHIQEKNGNGRLNLIHGFNISLGYDFRSGGVCLRTKSAVR